MEVEEEEGSEERRTFIAILKFHPGPGGGTFSKFICRFIKRYGSWKGMRPFDLNGA